MSFENSAMTIHADGVSLFPYFFLPINGALLWGWMPLSGRPNSAVVLVGLGATALFLGVLFVPKITRTPSAQMTLVMLVVAISMWVGGNGYGLFKIAMFIQPFLLSTLVAVVAVFVSRPLYQRLGLSLLCLSFIPAQQTNILRVSEDIGSSPVAFASSAELGRQLRELQARVRTVGPAERITIFSDTPSVELFALEAYYFRGITFDNLAMSLPLLKSVGRQREFVFSPNVVVAFRSKPYSADPNEYLLTTGPEFSVVNRETSSPGRLLQMRPLGTFTNHLILLTSSIGAGHLNTDVSFYQLERDPSFVGRTMSAVGRYHIYEVLGARNGSRVELSLSSSLCKQEDFRLPPIRVAGEFDAAMPVVGRGSARVFSGPLSPRALESSDYLGIDFGRQSSLIDPERKGVMTLFGNKIKLDSRKVVVYARNISYIAPSQYAAVKRPSAIRGFPVALADPGLEYSGIFEDGWISEAAYVVLVPPLVSTNRRLAISGIIPDVGDPSFSTVLTVKVNDRIVYSARHATGNVTIAVPLERTAVADGATVKVQIESSGLQRLPGQDGRPVSMHINMLSLK
jgi:hypothetical protein